MSPHVGRKLLVVGLAAPAFLIGAAVPAFSSTGESDPLFGDGCRYVQVETPTPDDPEVELCRPW